MIERRHWIALGAAVALWVGVVVPTWAQPMPGAPPQGGPPPGGPPPLPSPQMPGLPPSMGGVGYGVPPTATAIPPGMGPPPVDWNMGRFFYYPYYYYPHDYWPTQCPPWPEAPGHPYVRPPAYMAYPPFKEPHWRYFWYEPHRFYRGFHFWLDQF